MALTKKTMRITLVDGTIINDEIKPHKDIPFNAPANDMTYYQSAVAIAVQGYVHTDTNSKHLIIVAPSQIKKVEVVFEDPTMIIKN